MNNSAVFALTISYHVYALRPILHSIPRKYTKHHLLATRH